MHPSFHECVFEINETLSAIHYIFAIIIMNLRRKNNMRNQCYTVHRCGFRCKIAKKSTIVTKAISILYCDLEVKNIA